MTADTPSTPEGQLIRTARERAVPRLTIAAAAQRTGISAEQWGTVERGHTRARPGSPTRRFSAPRMTVARMAAAVGGVTPADLEACGRKDAADELRVMQAADRPADLEALFGRLLRALADGRPSPQVLETLPMVWRLTDTEGNLRPVEDRVTIMIGLVGGAAGAAALRIG